jgi:peptidase M50-like protein
VLVSLVLFTIVTIHEMGHTLTGLVLGMRLRALLLGPLHWRIRDGQWTFQFDPNGILGIGGATGVVPAAVHFPRWRHLFMIAAGPLVTLITGVFALWIALTASRDSAVQGGGLLALFGALSLTICAANLIPFRTGSLYSDGASMLQFFSGGPWADYRQAIEIVGASLVTPLRPRDYDIGAIQRAAQVITQGERGMLLRLYAYMHFLDCERRSEAQQVLREAESVCEASAPNIPPELYTVIVFGNAYLGRDAAAARKWWTRMEARKPTRFNSDYWLAASALHWIEGDSKAAAEAWQKADAQAQQLPQAGAYEFDRYNCALMKQVLNEVAAATS